MALRDDMKERVEFVLNDEGLDVPDEDILNSIINQCARTALLKMKRTLSANYQGLVALETMLGVNDTDDIEKARKKLSLILDSFRRQDAALAREA